MRWSDLPNWLSGVTVVVTLVVVWYARQTVREARNATAEEKNTVNELKKLVATAQETAASSATTMQAAMQTAEISATAREADQRYRQLEQFRAIHWLVLGIDRAAQSARSLASLGPNTTGWRCLEQDELKHAMVGSVPELPKCRELAAEGGVVDMAAAAGYALAELGDVFCSLGAEGG